MNCQKCGSSNTGVIDSRIAGPARKNRNVPEFATRRRIHCNDCGTRFNTFEIPEDEINSIDSMAVQKTKVLLADIIEQLN